MISLGTMSAISVQILIRPLFQSTLKQIIFRFLDLHFLCEINVRKKYLIALNLYESLIEYLLNISADIK